MKKLVVIGLLLIIAAVVVNLERDRWGTQLGLSRPQGVPAAATQAARGEGATPKSVLKAGGYKKSGITFTPTRWDFPAAGGTIENSAAGPPRESLYIHCQGLLAKAGATTADIRVVLYKSASQAGPFQQANAVTAPQRRIGPQTAFAINDDQRASLGGNWVYYKVVLLDATDALIAEYPPVRFPLIPAPKVSNDRLEWKPNDPARELPEGSLKVLWTSNNVCVQRAPLAASVSVALPAKVPVTAVAVDTVWPSRFNPSTGAWRYTFANEVYRFACPSTAPRPARNPALVQPMMSLDGRTHRFFQFHPKPDAFTGVRYYWEDDPGVSLTDYKPMAPVRSARRLIAEFQLRGSNQKGRATCVVLPNPGLGTVMAGNRKITVTFSRPELTAFWNALLRPAGRLVLERPYFGEVASSDTPVEALMDTEVENGKSYQYMTEFRDCYSTGTAWTEEQGEVPVLAPVDGSLVERSRGYSADAVSSTLNIAVLPSELCFEKTEFPAIVSLHRVIRALLADPRIQLLNRSALDEMLEELAQSAANTGKLDVRLPKAQYVLRFTDFTRLEGNGIALWLSDPSAEAWQRRSVRIGELMLPVKGDLGAAVDSAFVQPLAEFLKPHLENFAAPEGTPVEAKTLIFGTLLPAAQDVWFQESEALADDFAVATGQALPQKRILARRELSALLKERGLRQGQGGGQDDLSTGQVLVSGRIWWASKDRVGYLLLATDLMDGRIVDTFFVAQENDASRQAMAAWCAQLKTSAQVASSTRTSYAGTELRYDPLNPYWKDPGRGYKAASQLSMATTGAGGAIGLTLTQADLLWNKGDKKGAMTRMEELWFRRDSYVLEDAKIAAALLRAGATLAQWYHAQAEFSSEADIWKWVLAKNLSAAPDLSTAEVKNRYMRAQLLARDQPAGKKEPTAAPSKPAGSALLTVTRSDLRYTTRFSLGVDGALRNPPQLFEVAGDGTEREIKVPCIAFGVPFPPGLLPGDEKKMVERHQSHPLYQIRPVAGPEAPLLFPDYIQALLDFMRRDRDAFAKGRQVVQALRLEANKGTKLPADGGFFASLHGGYFDFMLSARDPSDPLSNYDHITAKMFSKWLDSAPWTMSQVIGKLPAAERTQLLTAMVDATGVGRGITDRRFLETVDGGTFLIAKWSADSGDRVAAQTCAAIQAWAKTQLQSVDLSKTGDRNSDYVYILLLADDPGVRDWLRVEKNLAATLRRTWHGNDLVRYLLDHGYPNAMSVALANRPVDGFSMLTFHWHNRQELEDSLSHDATGYSAAELRRLMGVLGRPDDEIEQAAARAENR